MKKLTEQQRRFICKKSRDGQRSHRKQLHYGEFHTSSGRQRVVTKTSRSLPECLCLHESIDETLSFLTELRKGSLKTAGRYVTPKAVKRGGIRQIRGYWDFTTLQKVTSGAALILAAEFDRIFKIGKSPPSAVDIEKWNPEVYSTLYRLGFFQAMGFTASQILFLKDSNEKLKSPYYIMPMVVGNGLETSIIIEPLNALLSKTFSDDVGSVALFGALIDAIENVNYHAYPFGHPDVTKVPNSWWLSGSVSIESKRLTVSLYDQGITIPQSMKLSRLFDSTFDAWSKLSRKNMWDDPRIDERSLKWAFNNAESTTGLKHRGRGLPNIKKMVSDCPDGQLLVLSGQGKYLYVNGVETFETTNSRLYGTYVEMSATFPGKSVIDHD